MALVSFVPGGLMGLGMAYLMDRAAPAVLGIPIEFAVHWTFLAGTFVVAGLTTVLAGCLPAARAAQLDVVDALKYE